MDYTLIRSDRKTVSLSVTPDGVVVRAPRRMPKGAVDEFKVCPDYQACHDWLKKNGDALR